MGTITTCMHRHSFIQELEKKIFFSLQLQLEETLWPGVKSVTRKIFAEKYKEHKIIANPEWKWKVLVAQLHPTLWDPMD